MELEPKHYYMLGVAGLWLIVRLALMYRRNRLIKRWQERQAAEANDSDDSGNA